ncbi:hypothetical protein D3C85_1701750 [compost metagenome]
MCPISLGQFRLAPTRDVFADSCPLARDKVPGLVFGAPHEPFDSQLCRLFADSQPATGGRPGADARTISATR